MERLTICWLPVSAYEQWTEHWDQEEGNVPPQGPGLFCDFTLYPLSPAYVTLSYIGKLRNKQGTAGQGRKSVIHTCCGIEWRHSKQFLFLLSKSSIHCNCLQCIFMHTQWHLTCFDEYSCLWIFIQKTMPSIWTLE